MHGQIGRRVLFCRVKRGDYFYVKDGIMIEAGELEGMCMYALPAFIPYLTAY